jgi:hypothetical protein
MESDAPSAENEAIWRYMDLPRFVSILSTGGLWFPKAATLRDDPWEGFGKAESFKVPLADDSPKGVVHGAADGKRTNISVVANEGRL